MSVFSAKKKVETNIFSFLLMNQWLLGKARENYILFTNISQLGLLLDKVTVKCQGYYFENNDIL